MCAEIVDVMLAASFLLSGNQKRFWRDPVTNWSAFPRSFGLVFLQNTITVQLNRDEQEDGQP